MCLGDGVNALLDMPRGSVALVIADLPYGVTKAKWDRQIDPAVFAAAYDHALAPDGVLIAFANFRLGVELYQYAKRRFLYDLIWKKNRKSGHLNAKRDPMRAHETLLVFGAHRYDPQLTYGHPPMDACTRISKSELYGRETVTKSNAGSTERYQSSILEVDCVANDTDGRIHSSQKPIDLYRWLIKAYTRPGDLVFDPTCGSGASLQAARLEGRDAIGWELHHPHYEAARNWLAGTDTPLFATAAP